MVVEEAKVQELVEEAAVLVVEQQTAALAVQLAQVKATLEQPVEQVKVTLGRWEPAPERPQLPELQPPLVAEAQRLESTEQLAPLAP